MKFALFLVCLITSTLSFSQSIEKGYVDASDFIDYDEGVYFKWGEDWVYTNYLRNDGSGYYVELAGSRLFRMWWCDNCQWWINDECEICPTCGNEKHSQS